MACPKMNAPDERSNRTGFSLAKCPIPGYCSMRISILPGVGYGSWNGCRACSRLSAIRCTGSTATLSGVTVNPSTPSISTSDAFGWPCSVWRAAAAVRRSRALGIETISCRKKYVCGAGPGSLTLNGGVHLELAAGPAGDRGLHPSFAAVLPPRGKAYTYLTLLMSGTVSLVELNASIDRLFSLIMNHAEVQWTPRIGQCGK